MLERDAPKKTDEPDHRKRFGLQPKTGTPLGLFGINWLPASIARRCWTAFIVDPAYWGGGYGTDGSVAARRVRL